jgi:hypothetical protein
MKKCCLFTFILFLFNLSYGQNTFYFMEHMPQKQTFNPAFIPKVDFFLNLPGMNGVSVNAYNSGFNYNELDYFLDQLNNPGYNADEFIQKIGESNRFKSEARANIFGFGFRIKDESFFSFQIASNHALNINAESDIVYLLTDYNDIDEIKFPVVVDGVDLMMNNYMNIGVNYSRKLNENLTIGVSPNINYNLAGIKTKNLSYVVDIESEGEYDYNEYTETFSGEAVLGLPVQINQNAISGGELDLEQDILPANWEEDLTISDLFKNGNFSVNLGATYQLNKWNFSASILNLGTSGWKRNAYRLVGNNDVIRVYEEKVKIGIPPKIYLGAARQFSPRWNYGFIFENTFYQGKSLAAGTLSLNGAVGRMLSTSFSYTAGYKFDNIGLGFRLRFFPGMDLFFVTDNVIQAFNYKKAYRMSGAVGINFAVGIKNYLEPTGEKSLDSSEN